MFSQTECETLTDKARGLQTNLDNAYKWGSHLQLVIYMFMDNS